MTKKINEYFINQLNLHARVLFEEYNIAFENKMWASVMILSLTIIDNILNDIDNLDYVDGLDINHFKSSKLRIIKGDSQNISEIFEAIRKNDIVIHLAEMVGDPLCEKKPKKNISNFTLKIKKFVLSQILEKFYLNYGKNSCNC